ncbi:MAG: EAL domain-containing protein [Gammaproteobacteria bacterium]
MDDSDKYLIRIQELEGDLDQRELELNLLREIVDLIGSEYNLQTVYEHVAMRARKLLRAETVLIPVLDKDHQTYTYQAADGEYADELQGQELPIEIGVCGWVFRNRKVWWRGVLEELNENERNRWEKEAGTLILVPLVGKQHFLGGIAAINKIDKDEFSKRDLDMLKLFAGQVSFAIDNAIFFNELNDAKQSAEAFRNKLESANKRLTTANEDLRKLAVHDPLTGLPNRTLIMDRLQQGVLGAKRNTEHLALLMIDLDQFKIVNDTLGHLVGDHLLTCVGQRFQRTLREVDTLGRLGGDEFAVVVPETDLESIALVASKLQSVLQTPVTVEGNSFSIGASIGIALYPEHGEDPATLLRHADKAMYVAKRNKDDYAFYCNEFDEQNPGSLALISDMRTAISDGTIDIALQPKFDFRSGLVTGVEALARWTHHEKGFISPVDFIPMLESTGLIKPFTLLILEKSIRECMKCRALGYDLSIAVNLSMHNLRDSNLPDQIADLLSRYRMERNVLMLEITESTIMSNPEHTMEILSKLESMGIKLSIDDFGTGYSSLSHLKKLPVHQLKIDRAFVKDVTTDNDDAVIVKSTIDLAHNLGLETVAEGIETKDVLDAIKQAGCDIAQGYLISKPLYPDDLLKFLEAGDWPIRSIKQKNTEPVY